ncbi:MAG: hypothetical protein M8357_10850 [Desulfobulbaceae bacterium]|nr:hypothetical protein [Desulfobulbaceae bacterium]
MIQRLVMVGLALLAGGLLTLPVVFMLTPQGSGFDAGWLSGAVWLLIPLIVALRKYHPQNQILRPASWKETLPEIVLVLFLIWYLFTGATTHSWFYFIQWSPYSTLNPFHSGPACFFFLVSCFWIVFLVRRNVSVERLILLLVLGTQVISFILFLDETKGLPLYRDDHPSFMFRLWALGSIFPRLTSFTPFWNGGVLETVIPKTGILGPGLLFLPLWKFAKIEQVYTPAIGFIYIFFIPWLTAVSLRFMRISWTGALTGCLLSGSLSLTYFLWSLHFGTIGANLSSAFVLPVGACLYRIVLLEDRKILTLFLLSVSAYFLILWPPGIIMLFAVLSGFLFHLRRFSWKKMGFLLAAGAITALLYLRQAVIILQGTELLKFVTRDVGGGFSGNASAIQVILSGFSLLVEQAHRANPLLVLLGVGGVFVLKDRSLRLWLIPIIILLLLIAGFGGALLPHLQLHRMIIPCLFILVVPAVITSVRTAGYNALIL